MQGVERLSVTFCKSPLSERGTSQAIKNSEPEMTSAESNQRARASKLLGAGTEMRGLSRGARQCGACWQCGASGGVGLRQWGSIECESSEVR